MYKVDDELDEQETPENEQEQSQEESEKEEVKSSTLPSTDETGTHDAPVEPSKNDPPVNAHPEADDKGVTTEEEVAKNEGASAE